MVSAGNHNVIIGNDCSVETGDTVAPTWTLRIKDPNSTYNIFQDNIVGEGDVIILGTGNIIGTVRDMAKSDLTNVTGTLPVENGGTGAISAYEARTNLGITLSNLGAAAASHTHGAGSIYGGTFAETSTYAKTGTDYSTYRIRNVAFGTSSMTVNSTTLSSGNFYLQYE